MLIDYSIILFVWDQYYALGESCKLLYKNVFGLTTTKQIKHKWDFARLHNIVFIWIIYLIHWILENNIHNLLHQLYACVFLKKKNTNGL